LLNHLETYIYTKNRIDLYNKRSIGLNVALASDDIENDGNAAKEEDES
jgi:hypothetical protein